MSISITLSVEEKTNLDRIKELTKNIEYITNEIGRDRMYDDKVVTMTYQEGINKIMNTIKEIQKRL